MVDHDVIEGTSSSEEPRTTINSPNLSSDNERFGRPLSRDGKRSQGKSKQSWATQQIPRTSLGINKLLGNDTRCAAGPPKVRQMPIPSYMLPIGKTRISSPDRLDPLVSTREVNEMFKETNLLSDVPQEEENRRLLEMLRDKAATARELVAEADVMWRQRMATSLDVSIGALKREHDRERKELKQEFENYLPNANLVEAARGNTILGTTATIKAKSIKPSKEHRDYVLKHLKVQEEHNITRFLVKRSALLIRQGEQIDKMRRSLIGPYKRLERIKDTQLEAINLALDRVEHKVTHSDRLLEAVSPLINNLPKIRSKRTTLETLEIIRHGLRLLADLCAKIPELYESVCIADGPIEMSLPTSDFRPNSPNFYPRSVVHGRSREDLVKELSSFLPYSDRSHLRSRSPSRERSRSPGPAGDLPSLYDARPNSAPAGTFAWSSPGASSNTPLVRSKSASGRRKKAAHGTSTSDAFSPMNTQSPVLWGGEGFDDTENNGSIAWAENDRSRQTQGAESMSPLAFYRLQLERKSKRLNKPPSKLPIPKREVAPSWSDYLDKDGRCPWCLELFEGEGKQSA